jgi:hypothetical protein
MTRACRTVRRAFAAIRLFALGAWLAGCGGADDDRLATGGRDGELDSETRATGTAAAADDGAGDAAGRRLSTEEARAIQPLLDAAERVRGLRFLSPVPTRVQSQDDIVAFVRAHIDREELEHARVFYVALGLLPPDLDVERMILAVMGEQIVGYYDPDGRVMVIREDVAAELGRAEGHLSTDQSAVVLVHEYVHALQDQHLGLHDAQDQERDIDGENAFASLVEGDATLAMIGWIVDAQGHRLSSLTRNPAVLRDILRSSPGVAGGAELDSAPAIVRAPLLSRYLDGLLFCAYLHGRGGFRWIDEAFRAPPVSTEQVLHPERWQRGERPEAITLPALGELLDGGLTVHDEDTLGELELSVYLAQGTDRDRQESAAAGWGGDRIRVYTSAARSETRRESAVVWFTTWDDEREAIEAEAAAIRVRDLAPAARAASQRVERIGRALLIVRDLEPALHRAVARDFASFARALPPQPRRTID